MVLRLGTSGGGDTTLEGVESEEGVVMGAECSEEEGSTLPRWGEGEVP